MSDQSPRKTIMPGGGFIPELTLRIKLILRLIGDRRVSPLVKILPFASLVYLIVPADLLPLLPFDDAAVLWISGAIFLELCPQNVVEEHMAALRLEAQRAEELKYQNVQKGEVVDAEFRDLGSQPGETKPEDEDARR